MRDEIVRLPVIKYAGKVKSSSLVVGRGQELRVSNECSASTDFVMKHEVILIKVVFL